MRPPIERLKIAVRGAVQGVGFRPFIFRLAAELSLTGWVSNSPQGVFIEIEGPRNHLDAFLLRLDSDKPPRSSIQSLEASWLGPVGFAAFEIRESSDAGEKTALVLPDIATCPDCLREIFDPQNRRHRYPFTNCTNCGPRFSIIESLPYDRANTSMKAFALCPQCQAEYNDPLNRRLHAQPTACPACGPHLELWNRSGQHLLARDAALLGAADAIRRGKIIAVKGLGGFHLMVAAHNDAAVVRLRKLKHREEKPFALMFPSLAAVKTHCEISPLEERLLRSPEAPIVLVRRKDSSAFREISPDNPNFGVMLPYTPLHHLLMAELGFPIVATSGNLSDEPICIDEHEALQRLGPIADFFLVHNRPIGRPVDDSIVRVMLDREMLLRRARGYAPLPIQIKARQSLRASSVLAVGAHLKSAVALAVGQNVFISQHLGDLETVQSYENFTRVIADLQRLYECHPADIAMDEHPDYLSTKFAKDLVARTPNSRSHGVQHHFAHVLACMAENEIEPPVLGVAWDGSGYGLDATIWGGEFLHVTNDSYSRPAHLRTFRLPGGDKAVKEPRRSALGLLHEMFGDAAFEKAKLAPIQACSAVELATIKKMLLAGLNSPLNSSVGRLFDAVAALIDLRQRTRFEGQAAMDLEFALDGIVTDDAYSFKLKSGNQPNTNSPIILDWEPVIQDILADLNQGISAGEISAKFHNALAEAIVTIAQRVGVEKVALSGGCFQNRYLTERSVHLLRQAGFQPYWHQRVPPNDGGIALGQVVAARMFQT